MTVQHVCIFCVLTAGWLLAACQATPNSVLNPVPVLSLGMTINATAGGEFVRPTTTNTPPPPVILISTPTAWPSLTPVPTATATATATSHPAAEHPRPVFPTATPQPSATPEPVVCVIPWFFEPAPAGLCPQTAALTSFAAAERFEQGQMFWIESNDIHFVLFNAHSLPEDGRQTYRAFTPLVLLPGASIHNQLVLTPPEGMYQPVSGFGLIWRNEVASLPPEVRHAIGWATEREYGFTATFQCAAVQNVMVACFLQDPYGQIISFDWQNKLWAYWPE